jgi:hypothetical protein
MVFDMYAVALITRNCALDRSNPLVCGVCPLRLQRAFQQINLVVDTDDYIIKL